MLEPKNNDELPAIPGKRYFTIGEVSELCGVKPHVLRYWEQEFPQLKPVKRRGNRRYYQRQDVIIIRQIRSLLYEQGFTIGGARNKLAGEEAIRAAGADHLIFRTSWVFAARGKNFLRTILRLAGEREELRIVADQFGAPTWARLIAEVTALALGQELARKKNGGLESATFNLTAAGETSWHGFASAIIAAARARGAKLSCRTVVPITTAEYPLPAARPANSRLAGARLTERYALALPKWEDCMQLCLAELFPA